MIIDVILFVLALPIVLSIGYFFFPVHEPRLVQDIFVLLILALLIAIGAIAFILWSIPRRDRNDEDQLSNS